MQAEGSVAPPGDRPTIRTWLNTAPRVPYSSHAQANGEPEGGNFLFEDGRVNWKRRPMIGVGANGQWWLIFYKIDLDVP